MNKRLSLIAAGALAAATLGYAHEGHKHEAGQAAAPEPGAVADAKTVAVVGEVIDLSCYMGHDGKGQEHQKCAKACLVEKHVPAGLLQDDGAVVLLIADHKHEAAFAPIPALAAQRVKVTGKRADKGGLNALLVTAAEKVR